LESLEVEVDRYRNEFNHLRYDYSFLKSEYEHEVSQKKTVLDELYAKFEIDKDALQKQIISLTDELSSKTPGDMHKLRLLQKENTQLNLQVKTLKDETEELRNKFEQTNVQTDQSSRLQVRQISELSIQCKSLESEKDTAKIQLDRVQKELENSIREQDRISTELHKTERENMQLKNRTDELIHSHKMELNNIKLDLTKNCCEVEQEKDRLQAEMNLYKSKSIVQESNINELKNDLELKEKEIFKRVQLVREEEWSKINRLECEKTQLESQITSLKQQKLEIQSSLKTIQNQMDDHVKVEEDVKERYERELTNFKNQMNQEKLKLNNSLKENEKLLETKSKYQKLLQSHDALLLSEQESKNEIEKSFLSNDLLRKELDFSQNELIKQRELHQKNLYELKRQSEDEKCKLHEKWFCLEKEYKELKSKYERLSITAKKKNKKLKSELEILSLQVEELKTKESHHQLEKQTLIKNMSAEKERMRQRYDKFRHRQHQFSQVLNTSNFNALDNFSPDARKASSFLNPDEFISMLPPSRIIPTDDPLNFEYEDKEHDN